MEVNQITLEHKYELKKSIEKMDKNELLEIFKIIKSDTKKYTENNNGIFINLKYLKKNTLKKIFSFVKYCKNNLSITDENENEKKNFITETTKEDYTINRMNEEFTAYQYELDNIDQDNIDKSIVYPKLNNKKPKLSGVAARILKQCKEINKSNNDYILVGKKQKKMKNNNLLKIEDNIDLSMDIEEMYSIINTDENDLEDLDELTIGY